MTVSSPSTPSVVPRTFLCVKVDTLGDLVVFSPTLAALRAAWPTTRFVVIIRRAYADLGPLLVPGVEWWPTSLDPFSQGPDSAPAELNRIVMEIGKLGADVMAAATSRRNWFEIVVAAKSGATQRVGLGSTTDDEFFATQLRVRLGIDTSTAFTAHTAGNATEPDWRRNFHLADTLLGTSAPRTPPRLSLPETVRGSVTGILREHGLERRRYVVCAAAGFANVALKTWPAEKFARSLQHLSATHGLRTLLVGHESEREHLAKVADAAGASTGVWLGRDGSLPQLAALIEAAALYLGNDTGAMHLAAALEKPVVAVFGGGTWPRFVPAGGTSIAVVQPLPCFGCGWDCAFGDAPCIREIAVGDVNAAIDRVIAAPPPNEAEVRSVEYLAAETRTMMGKAAARYHEARRDHLARQHKLEEITDLDWEKDSAIREKEASIHEKEASIHEKEAAIAEKEAAVLAAEAAMKIKEASIFEKEREIHAKEREIEELKKICNEREQLIIQLDRNARALDAQLITVRADKALIEKTLAELPDDRGYAVQTIAGQASHIRNLEALVKIREQEMSELRASAANHAAGRHDLEQAKHYGKLLAEKEAVIRMLDRTCREREAVIRQLTADATLPTSWARKLWVATHAFVQAKVWRPWQRWVNTAVAEKCWMQLGVLRQYSARTLRWDNRIPRPKMADATLPQIAIVTPSYGQERYIERTLTSVLEQRYPKLRYVVQDGGSKDRSAEIIAKYAARLHHWESVKDNGQADAIARGFAHVTDALSPTDLMAWINSDDLYGPGVLRFVAEYFHAHPDVDVLYGHRIIIDDDDREVGRWIMPRHEPAALEWIDYVPQETLFWRKRAWDRVGGIDPSFQFALDWDLLARFHQAGCKTVRVPYFLGAFRVHSEQKTTQVIHTTGADEMRRIRTRFHGEKQDDPESIDYHAKRSRFRGAITARLHDLGIRW